MPSSFAPPHPRILPGALAERADVPAALRLGRAAAAQRAFGRANEEAHSARARARAAGAAVGERGCRRGDESPRRNPPSPLLSCFSLAQVEREAAGALDTRPRDERDEADLSAERLPQGPPRARSPRARPRPRRGASRARGSRGDLAHRARRRRGRGRPRRARGDAGPAPLHARRGRARGRAPARRAAALATLLHACARASVLLARRDLGFLAFV